MPAAPEKAWRLPRKKMPRQSYVTQNQPVVTKEAAVGTVDNDGDDFDDSEFFYNRDSLRPSVRLANMDNSQTGKDSDMFGDKRNTYDETMLGKWGASDRNSATNLSKKKKITAGKLESNDFIPAHHRSVEEKLDGDGKLISVRRDSKSMLQAPVGMANYKSKKRLPGDPMGVARNNGGGDAGKVDARFDSLEPLLHKKKALPGTFRMQRHSKLY